MISTVLFKDNPQSHCSLDCSFRIIVTIVRCFRLYSMYILVTSADVIELVLYFNTDAFFFAEECPEHDFRQDKGCTVDCW